MASGGDDGSDAERSEEPTAKRRDEATKEGQIPRSQELMAAVSLMGAASLLVYQGGSTMGREARRFLVQSSDWIASPPEGIAGAEQMIQAAMRTLGFAVLPFLAGMFVLLVAVGVLQSRGVVTAAGLKPKWNALNPAAGFKRIVSAKSLFTLAKAAVKLTLLGWFTWSVLSDSLPQVLGLSTVSLTLFQGTVQQLTFKLVLTTGFAFLVVAAADYLFEVWQFEQGLKMTKQQVVEEQKQSEGNPQIKGRLKSLAMAMRRKRMLGDVKKADVVVTNPTHIAVALKYDTTLSGAPIVLAMGERKLAQRIKEIAKQHGVPTIENKPLARALLATAKVGKPIPTDLYAAVAEVLAWVYRRRGWVPA